MNIADVLQQPVDEYLHLFSPVRQRAILLYKFNADRNRTVWAELLIRNVLSKKLSLPFNKIIIDRDKNGKPYVVDDSTEISLSHSGNWVACSLGDAPNGIDIETDSTDALEIAKYYFTQTEYQNLCALDEEKRSLQFLKIWTLKESCFKCSGNVNFDNNIAGRNFLLNDGTVMGIATNKFSLPNNFLTYSLRINSSTVIELVKL